jgi:filamentous hemagglutinin family protein
MKRFNPFWIIRKGMTLFVTASLLAGAVASHAAPSGGVVTSGNAVISQNGNTTDINQSSQNAAINWQDFSIGAKETVNFNQPNVDSVTLNRIVGTETSVINGALNANGQVFILNSNGILFGKNASVNTSGLAATTMQLSDKNFMAGKYTFTNASDASIINKGVINISNEGYAALFGKTVENTGVINVVKGKVYMTGAESVTIDIDGNSLVELTVEKSVLDAMVSNKGAVIADGGEIYLTTSSADDLTAGVVNNTGIIQAEGIDDIEGKAVIFAHGGTANIGGEISTGAGKGFVETSGDTVNFAEGVKVTSAYWLIDPTDITVDATLADALESQLLSGSALIETTDGSITFDADVDVAGASTLSVDAYEDIIINSTINVSDTSALSLSYGNRLTVTLDTGVINLNDAGTIQINGENYNVIRTDDQLQDMDLNLTGKYVLGTDIDLNGYAYERIGDSMSSFTGALNGLGHTISNMTVSNNVGGSGLFGTLDTASVSNLLITDANSSTTSANAGILGGKAVDTDIYNVGVSGTVSGPQVGGLLGYSIGSTITNTYADADLTGAEQNSGGFIGIAYDTIIKDSYSAGVIEGTSMIGGFIGALHGTSSITGSYSSVDVTSTDVMMGFAGGLIGYAVNTGEMSNNYATGNVKGTVRIGGLIGSAGDITLSDSYATGTVDGGQYTGGLIGYGTNITVSDSYATGAINSTLTTGSYAGGFIGAIVKGSITNSYATGNVKGGAVAGGFAGYVKDAYISKTYASGNVDGADYAGGHFGYMQIADVADAYLTESYATGDVTGNNHIGGLGGRIVNAYVNNSYSTGDVEGSSNVGGLIGSVHGGNIENVYTFSDVEGTHEYAAGLVGLATDFNSNITNAFAFGTVTGSSYVAGLINDDGKATVTNSYFSSDANPSTGTDTYNVSAANAQMTDNIKDTFDTDTIWTGETVNMGFPLLRWQGDITDITLTFPSDAEYGTTGLTAADFLSDYASYGDYSYVVLNADGEDVTAQLSTGYLPAGTYTVKLVVAGAYDVVNSGTEMVISQKEVTFSLSTNTFEYGTSLSNLGISYSGTISGAEGITGATSYRIMDANNNDVTSAAQAGTLEAGSYTLVLALADDNYTVTANTASITITGGASETPETPEQPQEEPAQSAPDFIPAIISNIATQPVIQIEAYSPQSSGEFTQRDESGTAEAQGEPQSGDEGIADSGSDEMLASAYFSGTSRFSNSYKGLVEIINGGIKLPEAE